MKTQKDLINKKAPTESQNPLAKSRTRIFREKFKDTTIRAAKKTWEVTKKVVRHTWKPVTVTAAAVVTFFTLNKFINEANAQTNENLGKDLYTFSSKGPDSSSVSIALDSNSIKDVTVGISNGIASVFYGYKFMFSLDVKNNLQDAIGRFNVKPEDAIAIKNVFLDGKPMSYQIYETGVVILGIDASTGISDAAGRKTSPAGSKISMKEGDYIIASNGAMFIATKNDAGEYVGLIAVIPGGLYSISFSALGSEPLKSINFQESEGAVYLNEKGSKEFLWISIWDYHLKPAENPPVTSSGR